MSEKIAFETVAGQPLFDEVIASRKITPNLVADLELLGGESPSFFLPKRARIQPIYILGGNPAAPLPVNVVLGGAGAPQVVQKVIQTFVAEPHTNEDVFTPVLQLTGKSAGDLTLLSDLFWEFSITHAILDTGFFEIFPEMSQDGTKWDNMLGTVNTVKGEIPVLRAPPPYKVEASSFNNMVSFDDSGTLIHNPLKVDGKLFPPFLRLRIHCSGNMTLTGTATLAVIPK